LVPVTFKKLLVALAPLIVSLIVRIDRPAVDTDPFTMEAGSHASRLAALAVRIEEVQPERAVPVPMEVEPPPPAPRPTTREPPVWAKSGEARRRVSTNVTKRRMAY